MCPDEAMLLESTSSLAHAIARGAVPEDDCGEGVEHGGSISK
jgi:hypothetical protein